MEDMVCPRCGSTSTYRSKKFNAWICEDCNEKFDLPVEMTGWNSGLQSADFWCTEFGQSAPASRKFFNQLFNVLYPIPRFSAHPRTPRSLWSK